MDRRAFTKGFVALPFCAQSAVARAEDATRMQRWAIGFAPPVDRPLFATTQTRVLAGSANEIQLTVERGYQFAHLGRGFRLVSTITGVSDNAPPRLSRMLRAGIDPLVGLAIGFTIDASGRRIAVEDMAETWRQVAAATARTMASSGGAMDDSPLVRNIAAIDEAGRRSLLVNEVYDLIRYAGRDDVEGQMSAGGTIRIVESAAGNWQLTSAVNQFSGLCWQLDKAFVGANPPRHGIAGVTMQIRP